MTKRYPPEVREKAVRLALERLDEFERLRVWVKEALAQGSRPGGKSAPELSTAERDELAKLRKEVRDLKQASEILKLASAFVARELDPRHH
ncbi:hypothetical protein [Nocardia jejuensis]|uniref:hypothetical protein n=1 Tax=Nocardia jejuensis TaxID=328049 RepID=UPI00082F8B75|nr:hypothetical protein [Nocardia jejuensis]